MVRMVLGI